MASLSFFARGDGSSANNAALNVDSKSQQATVEITFESGATGDIVLDGNGGDVDPDTTVTIDGVSYNLTSSKRAICRLEMARCRMFLKAVRLL